MIGFLCYDPMTGNIYPLGREMAKTAKNPVPVTEESAEMFHSVATKMRKEDNALIAKKDNIIAQIEELLVNQGFTVGDCGEILNTVYKRISFKAEVR